MQFLDKIHTWYCVYRNLKLTLKLFFFVEVHDRTPNNYTKLRTTHHRMLLRILGAWCKSPHKRILSYKDALQQTECESIKTTVRTRRLLWPGALLRRMTTGYPRGSCRERGRTRENVGRGRRRNNGRTACQRIVGYLASRGTGAPPHLTLESSIAQYVKEAVGLWSRG